MIKKKEEITDEFLIKTLRMENHDKEDIKETIEWFKSRPTSVQEKIIQYPPCYMYIQSDTEYVGRIHAYSESEGGSCHVCQFLIETRHNKEHKVPMRYPLVEDRLVFDVPFSNLIRTNDLISI